MSRSTTKLTTGSVSVTSTPAQLVAARAGRSKLLLVANGQFYIGDSSVTASTGMLVVPSADGGPREFETQAEVWVVVPAGPSITLSFAELHD